MVFTTNSLIRDAWNHPLGHDVLQFLMRMTNRDEDWPKKPRAGRMRLLVLDRWAGKGFAQTLVDVMNRQPMAALPPEVPKKTWWKEAVIYHVYLPSFMDGDHDGVGDLSGVLQRLPYLQQLGVTAVWVWPVTDAVMPVYAEGNTQKPKRVGAEVGTAKDLLVLAEALHERNMRLITGFNMASTQDDHPWFQKALRGEKRYQDYYILRKGTQNTPPNNWGVVGGAAAWNWYEEMGMWGLRLLGRHRMDLNWENPEVAEHAAEILRFWQQHGVDGIALGAVNMTDKTDLADGAPAMAAAVGLRGYEHYAFGKNIHTHLHRLRQEALDGTDVLFIGETKGYGTGLCSTLAGDGAQLDMAIDATHLQIGGRRQGSEGNLTLLELKKYYLKWMAEYASERWMPLLLESPDHPRIVSRVGVSPLYRSILAKLIGTMQLTMRGTPIVYQGQELGLTNTRFRSASELRHGVSLRLYSEYCEKVGEVEALRRVAHSTPDNARTPMPWGPGPKGSFTGAEPWMRLPDGVDYLNASAQMQDKHSVWSHYQRLIALRRENEGLVYGDFRPVFSKNDKVFCYFRMGEKERWYIEMNITGKQVARPGHILPTMQLEASNYDVPAETLRPYEANVYKCL